MKFNVFNAQIGIKLDGLESRNTSLLAHGVGAHLDKEPLMSFISAGPADRLENLKPKRVTLNDTEILLIRDGENVYAAAPIALIKVRLLKMVQYVEASWFAHGIKALLISPLLMYANHLH